MDNIFISGLEGRSRTIRIESKMLEVSGNSFSINLSNYTEICLKNVIII